MPSVEKRLAAVLQRQGNERCSECDRPNNSPTWASFFVSPVDNRRLGVLCCPSCHHLHQTVGDGEFVLKGVREVEDFTEEDCQALELSGNELVNACYEAGVTNERDGREQREHGYEAHFFEKMMNLTYFNDELYKKLIAQSIRAHMERKESKRSSSRAPSRRDYEEKKDDSEKKSMRRTASGGSDDKRDRDDRRRDDKNRDENRDRDDRRRDVKYRDDRKSSRSSSRRDDKEGRYRSKSKSSPHRSSRSYDDDRKSSRSGRSSKRYEDDRKSGRNSSKDYRSKSSHRRGSNDYESSHRRGSNDYNNRREQSPSRDQRGSNYDDYNRGSSESYENEERRRSDEGGSRREDSDELRYSNRDLSSPDRTSSRDDYQQDRTSSRDEPQVRNSSRDQSQPVKTSSRDDPQMRTSSRDYAYPEEQRSTPTQQPPETYAWWEVPPEPEAQHNEQHQRVEEKTLPSRGSRSDLRGGSNHSLGDRRARADSDLRNSESSTDSRNCEIERKVSRGDLGAELRKEKMREKAMKRAASPKRSSSSKRLPSRQSSEEKSSSGGMRRSASKGDCSRVRSDPNLERSGMRRSDSTSRGEKSSRGGRSRSVSDKSLERGGMKRSTSRGDYSRSDSNRNLFGQNESWESNDRNSRRMKRSTSKGASSSRRDMRTSHVEPEQVAACEPTKKEIRAEAYDFILADREAAVDAPKLGTPNSEAATEHEKTVEALKATAPSSELLMHQKRIEALIRTAPNLKPEIVDALIDAAPQHLHAELKVLIKQPKLEPPPVADHKSTLAALQASTVTRGSPALAALTVPEPSTATPNNHSSVLANLQNSQMTAFKKNGQSPRLSGIAAAAPASGLKIDALADSISGGLRASILHRLSSDNAGTRTGAAPSRPSITRTSSSFDLNPRECKQENRRASLSRTGSALDIMSVANGKALSLQKAGSPFGKLQRCLVPDGGAEKTADEASNTQKSAWAVLKGRRADFIRIAQEELAEREAAGNQVAPDPTGDNEVTFGRRRIRKAGGSRRTPARSASGRAPTTPRTPRGGPAKNAKKTGTAWDILKARRADFIKLAAEELAERENTGNKLAPDENGDSGATFGRSNARAPGRKKAVAPPPSQQLRVRPSARNSKAASQNAPSAPSTPKTPTKPKSAAWEFLKSRRTDFIKIAMEEAAEREATGNQVAPDPTGDNEVNFGRRRQMMRRGSRRNVLEDPGTPKTPKRRGLQRGGSFSIRNGTSPRRGLLDADHPQTPGRRGLQRGSSFSMRAPGRTTLLDAPLIADVNAQAAPGRRGLQRGSSFSLRGQVPPPPSLQPATSAPLKALMHQADEVLPPPSLRQSKSGPLNSRPCYSGSSNQEVPYSNPMSALEKLCAKPPSPTCTSPVQDEAPAPPVITEPSPTSEPEVEPTRVPEPSRADYYKQKLNAQKADKDTSILSAKKRQERRTAVPTACA